ncbi:MAG: FAD-dependent thymidylate synthase [Candidatus Nanoarchaeia archaeon]|nr:FAD-dependent thymidylate synthase [Candidatus Nanoarchaeia archaeon]
MKIIEQSYEILSITHPKEQLRLIEKIGRVAYKSEDKINKESYKDFIKMIKERNHQSVLEHSFLSVKFITDRGISHELVRHRLASYTQESTRFCNYSKDKFNNELTFINNPLMLNFPISLNRYLIECEQLYILSVSHNVPPQIARAILPNCLKTEIVISTNFREWIYIFNLRLFNKTAHPQMRSLLKPLYIELQEKYPEIFDNNIEELNDVN